MAKINELISAISSTLHEIKAHNLPSACVQFGMDNGSSDEAFQSKRLYIENRLLGKPTDFVVGVAQRVLESYLSINLSNKLAEFISDQYKISLITRRNLIDELTLLQKDTNQRLSGRLSLVDFLKQICTLDIDTTNTIIEFSDEWALNYLLDDYLGILKTPDTQFLKFVDQLVHPIVRQPEFQEIYVQRINQHLIRDNYVLRENARMSGFPIYKSVLIQDGVTEKVKNLIFAAEGNKPEIVLDDSISNNIRIVNNEKNCLIYDLVLPATGLRWIDLVMWWQGNQQLEVSFEASQRNLFIRLNKSLTSEPEKLLFDTYFRRLLPDYGDGLPALIPQVYLHYDPYTIKQLQDNRRLFRQRMDFLLLFSEHQRIVIEVDGQQHYSDGDLPSPQKYSEMAAEDRRLRLAGYEIYRFGGYELFGEKGKNNVEQFFRKLLRKHGIIADKTK